jgi:hypothetical protein
MRIISVGELYDWNVNFIEPSRNRVQWLASTLYVLIHKVPNKNISWPFHFWEHLTLPTLSCLNLQCYLSRQCEILDISQPYRTPWPVTKIALLYLTTIKRSQ